MSKKKRYTITLTPEIAEEFRAICATMNLPVSTAINKLIERVVTLNVNEKKLKTLVFQYLIRDAEKDDLKTPG